MSIDSNDRMVNIAMGRFDSDPYGEIIASEKLSSWGVDARNQTKTPDIDKRALPNNLFGIPKGTVLIVNDKTTAESLLGMLTKGTGIDFKPKSVRLDDDSMRTIISNARRLAGYGMYIIIRANANLGAVKNLIKLFRTMEWPYSEPAKDARGEIDSLMTQCNLTPEIKNRLIEHVGEQYDQLLPLIKSIRELPKEEQREMTWENLWMRMNPSPGSIPPWGLKNKPGLFDYIIAGNVPKAIEFYDRLIASGTPVIQFTGWLASQIGQYAMLKLLIDYHGMNIDDAAHMVGLSAPKYRNNTDPFTKKRIGWLTGKNYECIAGKRIAKDDLRQLVKRTADDVTIIKKSGRIHMLEPDGSPMRDESGTEIIRTVDRPVDEMESDEAIGLRMVFRAVTVFSGVTS